MKMVVGVKNCMITGPPGSGKSTLLFDLVKDLKKRSVKIAGITTPEIRKDGQRWGFQIKNLKTGEEGILASVELRGSPRVSKYGVSLEDLNKIGVQALRNALEDESEVVVIDEIGKMELKSRTFAEVSGNLLDSSKIILGVMYYKPIHPLIRNIKSRGDTKVYWVTKKKTERERKEIKDEIIQNVLNATGREK